MHSITNELMLKEKVVDTGGKKIDETISRFLEKISIDENGCWNWTGGKKGGGYAQFAVHRKPIAGHRFIYDYYFGNLDPNLTIDHLCRNVACVNPAHLEQVTMKENVLRSPIALPAINKRKTHCLRGHGFLGDNLYVDSKGQRKCKECRRTRQKSPKYRKRGREYKKRRRKVDPNFRSLEKIYRRNYLQKKSKNAFLQVLYYKVMNSFNQLTSFLANEH